MDSEERVSAAMRGEPFDRVPVMEFFWDEFLENWRTTHGLPMTTDPYVHYDLDARTVGDCFTPKIDLEAIIEEGPGYKVRRDNWGSVRKVMDGMQLQTYLSFGIPDEDGYDSYEFEDPDDPRRYGPQRDMWDTTPMSYRDRVAHLKGDFFLFANLFDPYEAMWRIRGMENLLMDMVRCPSKVKDLAMRIADHMVAVGKHMMDLAETPGIWIWGDIAYNNGMMFSPRQYEALVKPALKRICSAFPDQVKVYHTDGDPRAVIPHLIDAGIDVLDPLENKAGMDVHELSREWGDSLGFVGNVDNTRLLVSGTEEEIVADVKAKVELAKKGHYIIGSSHSVGPDVSISNYELFRETVRKYGVVDDTL